MFRRFFGRKASDGAGDGDADQAIGHDLARRAQDLAEDDDIHTMVVRAGERQPDDPDEQLYSGDLGDHTEIARAALESGDLRRSVYHLGLALADDPGNEERLGLLDRWIATAGAQALDLVPLTDPDYFSTLQAADQLMRLGNKPDHHLRAIPAVGERYHAKVAVHAYILASTGRIADAALLLLRLIQVKPEFPYVVWFERWRDLPEMASAIDPDLAAGVAAQAVSRYPGTYIFSAAIREDLHRYLPLLNIAYTAHPRHQILGGMYAAVLRKCGQFEDAARVAASAPPSYNTFAARAMAAEALGDLDGCIAAYRQTFDLEPNDVAARNDIGNAYLVQGKLDEALSMYEESMRLDASDPFQLASANAMYLRHLLQKPGDWAGQLRTLAQRQGAARQLVNFLNMPYIGKLPYASESFINLMRTVEERLASGEMKRDALSSLRLTCTVIESPSARLALQRTLDTLGGAATMTIQSYPQPDTRQPLRPVEYQIWRYEGMDPSPVVPPPDPAVALAVADLAHIPFALDRWHAPARALGQRLGTDAIGSLLGIMAHPPAAPTGWHEWDWIAAVQIAAALTLAYTDSSWEGSRRKAALTSLMYGPMDWSGAAAVVAMAVLARQNKRLNIEFDHVCLDLWEFQPDDGPWALERAMVMSLLFVGNYSGEAKTRVQAYFERQRNERDKPES